MSLAAANIYDPLYTTHHGLAKHISGLLLLLVQPELLAATLFANPHQQT
jgi:hypothetical protein